MIASPEQARLQYGQLDGMPFDVTERLTPDTLANDLRRLASDPAPRAVHALLNAADPGMSG